MHQLHRFGRSVRFEHRGRSGRLAGVLYLIVVITGMFALAYVPSRIPLSGDAAVVLEHIRESASLFRMGVAAYLVMQVSFLLLALSLFRVLRPAGPEAAMTMVAPVAVSVPIALIGLSARLDALTLATDALYAAALTARQVETETLLALSRYYSGLTIARLFWGLWLLPLGYVILRSRLLPRVLGGLLVIGGIGYIVDVFADLLIPGYAASVFPAYVTRPAALGEIGTCLWLLVVGIRERDVPSGASQR